MWIRNKKLSQYILIFLCIILFIFLIRRSIDIADLEYDSNVIFGTIVVNEGDIKNGIPLTGTYKYIEDKIIEPNALKYHEDKVQALPVYDHGVFVSGHNATLYFDIYNYTNENLTLQYKDFVNKYKIYVNGIPVNSQEIETHDTKGHNPYIEILKNKKTQIVIQMRRDDYFLFGFLSPPILNTYTNLLTDYNRSQYLTLIITLLIFITCIFLNILSMIRSRNLAKNIHIILFSMIGVMVILKVVLTTLANFDIIHVNYMDFIKYKVFNIVLIAYFLFLFVYYDCPQKRSEKNIANTISYSLFIFVVFTSITPYAGQELLYKAALFFILAIQIASFYIARKNILSYQKNGILSLLILSIFYIFVFIYPDILLFTTNTTLSIVFLLCSAIIGLKIARDNYHSFANFRYLTAKQILLNDIYTNELSNIQKQLEIEKSAKMHAITIVNETKKRDVATGLYNRTYMTDLIKESIEGLKDNEIISLIIIDIDNLKHINEVYGHVVADTHIKDIANKLFNYKNQTDYLGRWTGGSFLVLLKEIEYATATYIAESIRLEISNTTFENGDSATVSIGVCCADKYSTVETTERTLNDCLIIAKGIGKNCVYTDTQLSDKLLENKSLIDQLIIDENDGPIFRNPYTGELL